MPCSSSNSNNGQCCNALLNLYCQLYQLFLDCPPAVLETAVTLQYLLTFWLAPTIDPIFAKAKCGRVFCCDGLVEAIYCAFQVALAALNTADDATAPAIFANLAATLTGILTQAGCTPPDYPDYPPPPP